MNNCTKKWLWLCAIAMTVAPTTSWAQDDEPDDLEKSLARELARPRASQPAPKASSSGLSNLMNPALSANASMFGGFTNREVSEDEETGDLPTGLHLQEVELRISAIVDPYLRADFTLAATDEEIGFEEAFMSTLAIPRVTIRAGRIFANVGRHNLLHTHAFPFLTAPLPWRALLGPEGVKDMGISFDLLLPLPFFTEINAQVLSGDIDPLAGDGDIDERQPEDLAYLGHLKTLFELGESTTLEVGGTILGGRNAFGGLTGLAGGDVTLKWRPIEAERYTSLAWTTEFILVDRGDAPDDKRVGGAYTSLQYQFTQRWWIQSRGALLGVPEGEAGKTWRAEALVAFVPSEFSALRLQYAFERADGPSAEPIHEVFLQAIISIGSHPTHAY